VPASRAVRSIVVKFSSRTPGMIVADNIMIGREGRRMTRRRLTDAERRVMADLAIDDVRRSE
jgi:hypothetical protein